MNNKKTTKTVSYFLLTIFAKIASLCKISIVFGTFHAFFSATSITIPLLGIFTGTLGSILFFCMSLGTRLLLGYGFSFKILAFYVPGLCASLYFAQRSWLWAVVVPLASMIMFCIHPVGSQTMVYSLYWLVPMVLFVMKQKTVFTHALTATFIAHAVGSVIWLYAQPATPAFWMALIPIVAIERLVYALGMVYVHRIIMIVCDHIAQGGRYGRSQRLRSGLSNVVLTKLG